MQKALKQSKLFNQKRNSSTKRGGANVRLPDQDSLCKIIKNNRRVNRRTAGPTAKERELIKPANLASSRYDTD